MCDPVTYAVVQGASTVMQYQQGKAQQKNQFEAQKNRNEMARKNALQRYASATLKIRQELKKSAQADFEGTKKARNIRAKFKASAGDAGGIAMTGSTNALLSNYYRTEGNYRNAIRNNMDINVSQFERNLEAIQFGQESQSTYLTPPNSKLLFATQAINLGNTYFDLQFKKQNAGLMTNKQKRGQRFNLTYNNYNKPK